MPNYKTKTTSAYTEHWPSNCILDGVLRAQYNLDTTRAIGANSITYEEGPKIIRMDGKTMSNWKRCQHRQDFSCKGMSYHLSRFDVMKDNPDNWVTYDWYSCPVVLYSYFGLSDMSSAVIPSSSLVDELWDEVLTDLAGRCNDYLLTLEDFAGFFSGKSLWKGVTGVASAVNGVAKAIGDCKKLGRAFGYRNSLYNMWLSSKEAVRQALGLRLGYRFSFKTTLNDIVKAVDFGYGLSQYLAQITKRNQSDYLRYSKTRTVYGNPTSTVYQGSSFKGAFLAGAPYSPFRNYWCDSYTMDKQNAIVTKRGGLSATAFIKARVRYPLDYGTVRHYYESRFGLDKPLTTLWAITPLSFVVDYLFNVQDALTYVDNKLNDYLVSTNIGSAWVCSKTFRESVLDIPSHSISWTGSDSRWLNHIEIPHIHTVYRDSQVFTRNPVASTTIRAQLPSLISADDNNWVRSVGTGLELLSQTRLR